VIISRIKSARIFLCKNLEKKIRNFDKKSFIGLILLLSPYAVGVITRQSASISNQLPKKFPACDSFIHGLCIPTMYIPIPLGVGFLMINLTSFLLSATLFLAGFFLVKKKSKWQMTLRGKQNHYNVKLLRGYGVDYDYWKALISKSKYIIRC